MAVPVAKPVMLLLCEGVYRGWRLDTEERGVARGVGRGVNLLGVANDDSGGAKGTKPVAVPPAVDVAPPPPFAFAFAAAFAAAAAASAAANDAG